MIFDRGDLLFGAVDEKKPIPADAGKFFDEVFLRNNHTALKDGSCECGDDLFLKVAAPFVLGVDGFSEFFLESPLEGIGVDDCGDGGLIGGGFAVEEMPSILGRSQLGLGVCAGS